MRSDDVIKAAEEAVIRAEVGLAKAATVLNDCTTRVLRPAVVPEPPEEEDNREGES